MSSQAIEPFLPNSQAEAELEYRRTEAETCRRSLTEFVKAAWPWVEQGRPLHWSWYIDAVCNHLQAVAEGKLRRLIINIPPGTGKSTLVSVLFPVWWWIRQPNKRFIFASYASDLSMRDSRRRRLLIQEDWFKERWGDKIQLQSDQNRADYFTNSATGHMISLSVGGQTTGHRGEVAILDDPHDAKSMESEQQRLSTLTWFDRVWPNRKNEPSAEIIIQQRTHEEDVTGHALKQGEWTLLKLPMEYAEQKNRTDLGWEDPRTTKGDLLAPILFPEYRVKEDKRRMGPYATAGQFQQEPAPAEGGIIKSTWINEYEWPSKRLDDWIVCKVNNHEHCRFRPMEHFRFCTIDPATTDKEISKDNKQNDPDFFFLGAWVVFNSTRGPYLCLMDVELGHWEGPDHEKKIEAFHATWKFALIGVESVAFQLSLFQKLKRRGLPVRELSKKEDALIRIDGDKTARAYNATPLMADQRFWIPSYSPWLGEYRKQLLLFPNAAHDDCVDGTTYAIPIAEKYGKDAGFLEQEQEKREHTADAGYNIPEDRQPTDDPLSGWRIAAP